MNTALHRQAVVLLLLVYGTTGSALAVSSLLPIIQGKGPEEVAACKGTTKEPPCPTFVQHRHIPMVKLASLPSSVAVETRGHVPDFRIVHVFLSDADTLPSSPPRTSRSGRSPPEY